MNDHQPLFDRLEALLDHGKLPDWDDVGRRAGEPEKAARPVRRSRRSYPTRRLVPVLIVAMAALVVGLVAPWQSGPSFTGRALAAIGDGPVIHAVMQSETGSRNIDLASGRETPQILTTEIWFDNERHIEHWKSSVDGQLQREFLETPTAITTSDMPAQTQTRDPELDPALAGFVDGYRSALESGTAHETGTGTVNGHEVTWIEFALNSPRGDWKETERVAVDASTTLPLRIERYHDGLNEGTSDVVSIETLPRGEGNFTPSKAALPNGGMRSLGTPVTPPEAVRALPNAVWAGSIVSGLSLFELRRMTLKVTYAPGSEIAPPVSNGLEIHYGNGWAYPGATEIPDGTTPDGNFVWLEETTTAHSIYSAQLVQYEVAPPTGSMLFAGCSAGPGINRRGCTGLMFESGVYVYISASNRDLLLAAARALEPIQTSAGTG